MTLRPGNCESRVIKSSDSPSEKYCCCELPLSLANGNTATDALVDGNTDPDESAEIGASVGWALRNLLIPTYANAASKAGATALARTPFKPQEVDCRPSIFAVLGPSCDRLALRTSPAMRC